MPDADFSSPRLYVDEALEANAKLVLEPGQANYLRNVLRFTDGARLLVFNGRDGEWWASFQPVGKRGGEIAILELARLQAFANDLWYVFAPLKHARLDYVVQKAVEMGVSRLQPVFTERTQVSRINQERMRANIIEACEQCGVLYVPELADDIALMKLLDAWPRERRLLFCDENAPVSDPYAQLRDLPPGPLAVLIGPEGGFSQAERKTLLKFPFVTSLALGPRILRADTAAVAVLAIVQSALGDWRDAQA